MLQYRRAALGGRTDVMSRTRLDDDELLLTRRKAFRAFLDQGYTVAQTARYFGVKPSTVYKQVKLLKSTTTATAPSSPR
jgi:transposase